MKPPARKMPATARIALLTGIACVGCCALPWIGIVIGSATMAELAAYSEWAVSALIFVGFAVFIIRRMTRRDGPACDLGGSCNSDKSEQRSSN